MKAIEMFEAGSRQPEIDFEMKWIKNDVQKYLNRAETDSELYMDHVQSITNKLVRPFISELELFLKKAYGQRGPKNPLLLCEEFITVPQMAFLAVSVFQEVLLKDSKFITKAHQLSRHLQATMRLNVFNNKKISESDKQSAIDRISNLSTAGVLLAEIFFNSFGEYYEPLMDNRKAVKDENGETIFELRVPNIDHPNYFRVSKEYNPKTKNYEIKLSPTEKLTELLESSKLECASSSFAPKPMIMKPDDWDNKGRNGGYYSDLLKMNKDLDQERNICKPHVFKSLKDHNSSTPSYEVIRAVNAIQSTPWRVNKYILHVVELLSFSKPETLKKVFPATPRIPERPKKLKKEEFDALSDDDKKILKRKMSDFNRATELSRAKKSVDMDRETALRQAKEYAEFPEIFFPYDLDYRGRIYAISMTGLNPQGSDLAKGLIQLAKGRKIRTESGLKWLRINLANMMYWDKLKLEDRIEAVIEYEEQIKACVDDPFKNTEWHSWDKPIQGLACAYEYVKYLRDPDAELHVHIQLDGLCNGVQNLCAITKDDQNAPNLGLIPTEERGDIYDYVAKGVIEELNSIVSNWSSDEELGMSQRWLNSELVDRNFCKRPVMTRSYAATLYGIKDRVKDYVIEKGKENCFDQLNIECNWMGELLWNTMNKVLARPMSVMDYFQAVAEEIGRSGKAMRWTTPSGMSCYHAPRVQKTKKVDIKIYNKKTSYGLLESTDKINWKKMKSSVAPNIIHSFDASHLVLTTNLCLDNGIDEFAFVHDSFGTYPDKAEKLLECTKLAWIQMYSENQLERLYVEWSLIYPECEIPHYSDFVMLGELNIEDVIFSDFFFA